ncbi:MAG: SDR family oxidoreductase [Rhodospirillaceae bacterium]|jgi:NAD(P)-dependent dehydrogenase (short-subunit alcohol dehydrogenase family)|nr:SDR family oxidoreductase [Rhodospirillaceae bacterium]MBT5191560.1 SDR family oxidoreductase [Rhodospirillaceae bacterium]MBT5894688.1 SDR family oxidoreductase [Rhodospirillaceae bacterium]MBT6429624.1 SDR family oxidoreductase [Rhodospirillaceae bacterium]
MADNKVIAVTGASRGIGSGIVAELAARGHTVGCLSRKGQGPEDREVAGSLIHVACDMEDEGQIAAAVNTLAERAGRIDVLVNNAGLHLEGVSAEVSKADFERVLATNITGPFLACREVYPHMVANGGGLIINIGSFFDRLGAKRNLAYNCTKSALGALTRTLAVEWARDKIRVLDLAPGFVATDLNAEYMANDSFKEFVRRRIPVGHAASIDEVARLIAVLVAEDLPSLTGETIFMDGGQNINQ